MVGRLEQVHVTACQIECRYDETNCAVAEHAITELVAHSRFKGVAVVLRANQMAECPQLRVPEDLRTLLHVELKDRSGGDPRTECKSDEATCRCPGDQVKVFQYRRARDRPRGPRAQRPRRSRASRRHQATAPGSGPPRAQALLDLRRMWSSRSSPIVRRTSRAPTIRIANTEQEGRLASRFWEGLALRSAPLSLLATMANDSITAL